MKKKKFFILAAVIFTALVLFSASASVDAEKMQEINALDLTVKPQDIDSRGTVKPDLNFGKFLLYFIFNKGQVNEKAKFYAKASRYTLWLTKEGLVFDSFKKLKVEVEMGKQKTDDRRRMTDYSPYSTHSPKLERDVSRLVFLDANKNPGMVSIEESKLRVNYFIGNDKSKWHCDVPTSMAVLYNNLYKNIDLKVYGIEKQIEYDWIVKPGGNPKDIRFEYKNVKGTRLDDEGNLLIETDFGELIHKKPVSYQEREGVGAGPLTCPIDRRDINVTFKKIGKNTYGFEVGAYDRSHELVIDPVVLAYSTYLGGGNVDFGWGIAVDDSGNAYVTGSTYSTDFPTLNQYQAFQGSVDVFVAKLDTTQSGTASLLYSTYLGGGGGDDGNAIAVDGSGNAYVTGYTNSTDFPTINQYQVFQGAYNAFVAKLDTTQSGAASLLYSTYLGGGGGDNGRGIAVDDSGNAYVTGSTYSTDFPTLNQYQAAQGNEDAFVAKLDPSRGGAASLLYSTYLGGGISDIGVGIAVDGSGNAYLTGYTNSTDFPTLNQYQAFQGDEDAFVAKLDTTQSGPASLLYSTYLGGGSRDEVAGISVDGSGNAYVTGWTDSTDFPTLNRYQAAQGNEDAFVAKLDTTQSGPASLLYSTYLGGGNSDYGYGIAVDGSGNTYVTGWTASTDFPILNQYQAAQGNEDAFVAKLDTTQSDAASLLYSTYLGGGGGDSGEGISVDGSGNAYVTGVTLSGYFPTLNQYQAAQGSYDAFVTKLSFIAVTPPTVDTPTYTNITYTTADLGGNVSGTNGANVTERGVYWSITNGFTPPEQGTKVSETGNGGIGPFTVNVTGLPAGTTIYFQAFATNTSGTGYSAQASFTTPAVAAPTVNTTAVSNITLTTASSGGNVKDDGGAVVTARGVCWSTSSNPTTSDSHTTNGNGTGTFTSSITGLTPDTTYYLRAYATNTAGTGYGNQVTFTTAANPTISGTVTNGANPIEGVTITFSYDGHTETTNADGYYSYTVTNGISTVVTASKPGYTFTPPQYSYTNLTENEPNQGFTVLNSVSVTITNLQNGDTVSGAVIIDAEVSSQDASAAYASIQAVTKVEFYIDGMLVKQDVSAPYQHRWETTLVSNGNHTIEAMAYHSCGITGQHIIMVNVSNSTEPPHITLNRTSLNFGAVIGEPSSGSQNFLITNSGGGTLNWTASASETWIQATPLNGTANTQVSVSVDITGLDIGDYAGTVLITDANADNSPVAVDIFLTVNDEGEDLPLIGSFDSPIDGSTVSGSIPVTGWALDDTEIASVKIYRHPIWGQELGFVYIGEAVFVEGARPDIEIQYPQYPRNYEAGWGYMLLTNSLPNEGNGTFVITAIATGSSGSKVVLGSKTIICDNENSTKPFGTIDTPGQGGDAFGTEFVNFGWALTPLPNIIPTDGSTIKVWVDGVPLIGHPVYNNYREDIAAAFPGYNNSDGAVGYYFLDTTLYANGIHTISWSVTDNAGNTDGIGSRYFRILDVETLSAGSAAVLGHPDNMTIQNLPVSSAPIHLKKGYETDSEPYVLYPDNKGSITIDIKEDDRIEIQLGDKNEIAGSMEQETGRTDAWTGFLLIGHKRTSLPIGSTLDVSKGIFYWQPGTGFIGEYQFVFIEKGPDGELTKKNIKLVINPKF